MNTLFVIQFILLIAALGACYKPLGDYMGRTFATERDIAPERWLYRWLRVDPRSAQTWQSYARSVLAFSVVGLVLLYLIQRLQAFLPFAGGHKGVEPFLAFNTAASFATNTNWQNYSPEQTLGHSVQMFGLTVQNFVSGATGLAVAIALVRGFAYVKRGTIGNFWVDATRAIFRILLPLAVVSALVLLAGGVIQNLVGHTDVTTIAGGTQSIPGGPVASQEAIKLLGTNGGGFFNANSAHPFENPNAWTNIFEVFLMLVIPFSLPRTFGWMVGNHKQGYTILGVMGTLFAGSLALMSWFEMRGAGAATQLAGAALEGKELAFGVLGSTLFGTTSTSTSTGAVNMMHDSMTPQGGLMAMINMMLGEISPGGVGTGLYGLLILAVITVFIAGLLVGRTPEYLGKKIGPLQMKLASLYVLVTPTLVLAGTALSFALPWARESVTGTSILNTGPHGLSEVLYAFTSAANNNGSAFAGLTGNTPWLNASLGVVMILGRFIPIVLALALAGSLSAQTRVPSTSGTLPTTSPLYAGMLMSVAILVSALTYFPALTLGPLAEGMH